MYSIVLDAAGLKWFTKKVRGHPPIVRGPCGAEHNALHQDGLTTLHTRGRFPLREPANPLHSGLRLPRESQGLPKSRSTGIE